MQALRYAHGLLPVSYNSLKSFDQSVILKQEIFRLSIVNVIQSNRKLLRITTLIDCITI